jgi:Tol biopolymer transport system component
MSANGTRLAYSAVLQTTNVQHLAFDPATGSVKGEEGWVTTGSRVWSSPDPSSDAQWVTFYSRLVPEGDIYIARSDGTGLRQVTGDAALDRVPRWSPDGNWIAFFSNRSGPYQVWKVHPDGSDLQQMTERSEAVPTSRVLGPPRLSRDGRQMYFSRRITESDIWTVTFK